MVLHRSDVVRALGGSALTATGELNQTVSFLQRIETLGSLTLAQLRRGPSRMHADSPT
jgi:hypothetical protein